VVVESSSHGVGTIGRENLSIKPTVLDDLLYLLGGYDLRVMRDDGALHYEADGDCSDAVNAFEAGFNG
jgi:hypothetical protein